MRSNNAVLCLALYFFPLAPRSEPVLGNLHGSAGIVIPSLPGRFSVNFYRSAGNLLELCSLWSFDLGKLYICPDWN